MSIPLAEAERRITEARRVRIDYRFATQALVPGTVTINGVSSLLIDDCVVDHKFGAVTLGGWEAALRNRATLEAER